MLKLLLVDDHALVRSAYRRLMAGEPDMQVVAEAAHPDEAVSCLRQHPDLDVVVMDLSLKDGSSGIDAISRLLARAPELSILVCSMHDSSGYITQAWRAGARGYLSKHSDMDTLLEGIRQVAAGRRVFPAGWLPPATHTASQAPADLAQLTPREFDVLCMAVQGTATEQIAQQLHLSPKTICNYLSIIRQKLNVDNDFSLMRLVSQHGLLAQPIALPS